MTEGKSGVEASSGKGSAKHASDAGLMMAWYSAPQSLAPEGASPDRCLASVAAPEGAGRASPQSRGSAVDATARAPSATSRSRAKGGVSWTAIALRRAVDRAGPTTGRACRGRRAVARGLVRDGGAIRRRAPMRGNVQAGAPNGWRDRCLRDTPRSPHATAREYASRADAATRCGIRTTCDGGERIAHHNLAHDDAAPGRLARPRGAVCGASIRCRFPNSRRLDEGSADEFGGRA